MIEFKNIEIKYGNFIAMHNLNLTINDGEFFTFLGPSGCGKTTTLRSLVGLIQPSAGQIIVDGEDITALPAEKRKIGMVFQSYALFPTMTVYENIAYGLKVKHLPKEEIRKKVDNIAEVIEINKEQLRRNVSELSGGQQQRVALARAIVLEPKILCLDEPLSNLDAKLRISLRRELKNLQKRLGITTLYVTHDQVEALTLSDRIAVFNNGYVEQVGTPYDVYNHSASEFVCDFLGDICKLQKEAIIKINTQSGANLDPEKVGYIRIERIAELPGKGRVELEAVVESYEYDGVFARYMLNSCGQTMKHYVMNDGKPFLQEGEMIKLYIDPADIMQF